MTPKASAQASARRGATPCYLGEREGGKNLEWPIIRFLNQNVRHSSSPTLAEIEVESHCSPAPLTGAEALRKNRLNRH